MESLGPKLTWSVADTKSLIETRTALNEMFIRKRGMTMQGWEMVAVNLRCGASALQCKKKFENLQLKYKNIILPPTGKGLEEEQHPADTWPYYDAMQKFMSGRHTITPLLCIQSATAGATSNISPGTSHNSPHEDCLKNINGKKDPHSASTSASLLPDTCLEENQPPAKKRRVAAPPPNKDSISELVSFMREDMMKQAEDRAAARQADEDLLGVLREFLLKK